MYTNILIPTDGSELAEKAVQHGIALAKRIGAKATVLTVLTPFHTFTIDTQMIEDTPAQYKIRMKDHAEKTLGAAADAAQAAGVACETVQVEHEHAYQAIIDTAGRRAFRHSPRMTSSCRRPRNLHNSRNRGCKRSEKTCSSSNGRLVLAG